MTVRSGNAMRSGPAGRLSTAWARVNVARRVLRESEEFVAGSALAGMVLLLVADMALRPWYGSVIPGAQVVVRQLTMWVALLGAALAARDGRLLALATGDFLGTRARKWAGLAAATVAVAVATVLCVAGITVVADVALKLEAKNFGSVTPADWTRLAKENDRPEADGIFLSCTNTTQIEAIGDIEKMLGKPVVNSNQAVLWGCMRRLKDKVPVAPMPQLGRLMQSLN